VPTTNIQTDEQRWDIPVIPRALTSSLEQMLTSGLPGISRQLTAYDDATRGGSGSRDPAFLSPTASHYLFKVGN